MPHSSFFGLFLIPVGITLAAYVYSNWQPSPHTPRLRSPYGYYSHSWQSLSRLNWLEMAVSLFVTFCLAWGGYFVFRDSLFTDTEFLNGSIAEKGHSDISCRHCRTVCDAHDSDGDCTASHTECDHTFDRVWWATTDYAEFFPREGRVEFPTEDRQGLMEPARWTAVVIGEPATTLHKYTNYLSAAGDSPFHPHSALTEDLRQRGYVPRRFTDTAYDHYRAKKFVYVGQTAPVYLGTVEPVSQTIWTVVEWNTGLLEIGAPIGPEKQGNAQIVVTDYPDQEYANAVLDAWAGGAKNDIDLFLGVDGGGKIVWVVVKYGLPTEDTTEDVGQGNNSLLAVTLRDRMLDEVGVLGDNTRELTLKIFAEEILEKFNRTPNKQFEHLKAGVHPTSGQMTMLYVIVIVVNAAMAAWFYTADPFYMD